MPIPNNFRPGETRTCITLNGVNGEFLREIGLHDVHVTYGGGGTAEEAARRDVPKMAGEYFELGTLPAYGLYARGVRGLSVSNVRFEVTSPDLRPAVVFEGVEDAAINGMSAQGNEAAELVRLRDSRQVLISASRVLTPAATFLHVEGSSSSDIVIDGGDLSRANQLTKFTDGATNSAVRAPGRA